MTETHTADSRWSDLEAAVRDGCLKTCEFGPQVSSQSHGPDGNAQVCITTCREHCELALLRGMKIQGAEHPVTKAVSKAGEGFITTGHFDEGDDPAPKKSVTTVS